MNAMSLIEEAATLAHFGCWESDLLNHTELWSDELYKILGFVPGEVIPSMENLLRKVHPEDVMMLTEIVGDVISTQKCRKMDCRLNGKDGSVRYVTIEMTVKKNNEGTPVRLIGCMQDISDARIAELNEKKINADLAQRNKDLEQFAYIISHNLRAPVANIVGVSNTLLDGSLEGDEIKEFMGALAHSVKRLDNMITDLNHILQVKKHVNENMEMVNFRQLVEDIKSNIGVFLKDECIMILSDFEDAEEMWTLKSYLRSIFYNLISNSIKYRKPNMAPVVEIKSRKLKDKIELTFKDNSIGIDLKNKGDQIFGLYKRFHPDHAEGKGMGLFMVKTQVETLGGTIAVQSKVNEGAEFRIVFKLQKATN